MKMNVLINDELFQASELGTSYVRNSSVQGVLSAYLTIKDDANDPMLFARVIAAFEKNPELPTISYYAEGDNPESAQELRFKEYNIAKSFTLESYDDSRQMDIHINLSEAY